MAMERQGRWYAVSCDNCGTRAGWAESEEEAQELADREGWNCPAFLDGDYCPTCYIALQEEDE